MSSRAQLIAQLIDTVLTEEDDLGIIRDALARAEHPPAAVTATGKLRCKKCKRVTIPELGETGYYRRNHVTSILPQADGSFEIRAWGGGSEDFGEDGDCYVLTCMHCGTTYMLPDNMTIEWE